MIYLTIFCSATLFGLYYCVPVFAKSWQLIRLRAICRARGALVLTYDDGPSSELTPALLDILDKFEAKATFFVLGRAVDANPTVLQDIVKRGHEIGSHGRAHKNAWKSWPWQTWHDIRNFMDKDSRQLANPVYFRPPYGKLTLLSHALVLSQRMRLAWWTIDSGDTWRTLPAVRAVTDAVLEDGGGVVLLHDFYRDSQARVDYVLQATQCILKAARDSGLKVVTFSELLNQHGAT